MCVRPFFSYESNNTRTSFERNALKIRILKPPDKFSAKSCIPRFEIQYTAGKVSNKKAMVEDLRDIILEEMLIFLPDHFFSKTEEMAFNSLEGKLFKDYHIFFANVFNEKIRNSQNKSHIIYSIRYLKILQKEFPNPDEPILLEIMEEPVKTFFIGKK